MGTTKTDNVWEFAAESLEDFGQYTIVTENKDTEKGGPPTSTRYVSLDKSTVNLTGTDETLFFVRDMTALVNMQQLSHMRQLLSTFAEKCFLQIQESQRINIL